MKDILLTVLLLTATASLALSEGRAFDYEIFYHGDSGTKIDYSYEVDNSQGSIQFRLVEGRWEPWLKFSKIQPNLREYILIKYSRNEGNWDPSEKTIYKYDEKEREIYFSFMNYADGWIAEYEILNIYDEEQRTHVYIFRVPKGDDSDTTLFRFTRYNGQGLPVEGHHFTKVNDTTYGIVDIVHEYNENGGKTYYREIIDSADTNETVWEYSIESGANVTVRKEYGNGVLTSHTKLVQKFDSDGRLLERRDYEVEGNEEIQKIYYKNEYDDQGRLTLYETLSWDNFYRRNFYYSETSNPDSTIVSLRDSVANEWVKVSKELFDYDDQGRTILYGERFYYDSPYDDDYDEVYTYDSKGNLEKYEYNYYDGGGHLTPMRKQVAEYNSRGELIEWYNTEYDFSKHEWFMKADKVEPEFENDLSSSLFLSSRDCYRYQAGYLTSVEDEEQNPGSSSLAFPNPATGTAVIKLDRPIASSAELQILESNGSVAKTLEIPADATEIPIDVSGYSAGVYLYRIQSGPGAISGKIVVIK